MAWWVYKTFGNVTCNFLSSFLSSCWLIYSGTTDATYSYFLRENNSSILCFDHVIWASSYPLVWLFIIKQGWNCQHAYTSFRMFHYQSCCICCGNLTPNCDMSGVPGNMQHFVHKMCSYKPIRARLFPVWFQYS